MGKHRIGVEQLFGDGERFGPVAFGHVAKNREWCPGETDQWYATIQLLLGQPNGVQYVAEVAFGVGHAQAGEVGGGAHGGWKHRPPALEHLIGQAHRFGHDQYVGEDNGRVDAERIDGLNGHLGG